MRALLAQDGLLQHTLGLEIKAALLVVHQVAQVLFEHRLEDGHELLEVLVLTNDDADLP